MCIVNLKAMLLATMALSFLGAKVVDAGQNEAARVLPQTAAAPQQDMKKTYTYKTVGSCAIKADVYRASGDDVIRPVVIWVHGGALIMGSREQLDKALLDKLLRVGYAVVSIDYRLAPQAKLPGILEDLDDAFRWVRIEGPALFQIDPSRIAVVGRSARRLNGRACCTS